jgi:hypothetical protein
MTTTLLSWPVFFQALQRQNPAIRHAWLRYWIFSDEGAALLARSKQVLEERQKQLVLLLLKQKTWLNTLR